MRFDNFYGNAQAKDMLSGIFDSRRIPHAILIDGPEGCGKKTLAHILAAAAVCNSPDEIPCGNCRQCHNAVTGNHPDIVTFTGTGNRSFGVDAVRKIRLDAYVSPNDSERKVYILANIQDMTEQAQNALLKILEEPPKSVLFILTCDSRTHVLETVRSRAQCLSLGPVAESEIMHAIEQQCGDVMHDDVVRASRLSGGIIGSAKRMLDAGFLEISQFYNDFTKALCATDSYLFLSLSGKLEKDSELYVAFLDMLPALMRDAVAIKSGGATGLSGCEEEARILSRFATMEKLYRAQLTALASRQASDRNANLTLQLTTLFSQLWKDMHS
jgi:DNA polymerase III delta' subunit